MKKVNISVQTRKELKVLRRGLGFGTYSQTISFLMKYYNDDRAKHDKKFNQLIDETFGL